MRLITPTVLAVISLPVAATAQMATLEPDPDMPVKAGFDTGRAIFWAQPNFVPRSSK